MQGIDLVVPWVDGNDPKWQKEKECYYMKGDSESDSESNALFRDWNLLRYWFRGVEKNLPWIRKIHFVTWGHVPEWLDVSHPKLEIVRHCDYIPKRYLPTFSSNTILLNLHRIEGLAEKFVLANDDLFFVEKISEKYFFEGNQPCEALVLTPITDMCKDGFGHILWNIIACMNRNFDMKACVDENNDKWFHECYPDEAIQKNQMTFLMKEFPGFGLNHSANAYLKSTFEKVWEKEGKLLDRTCRHRFRSIEDVTDWLMRYWQLAEGNFSPRWPEGTAFATCDQSQEVLRDTILSGSNKIICLNEGSGDVDFEERSAYLQSLFNIVFPEMSTFEKF